MYDNNVDNCNGKWHGLNSTYEVDAQSENLIWVSSMAHGRWYPTLVTLPDGKVVVTNGLDEFGSFNRLTEVYDPSSKAWAKSFDPNTSITYCVGYGSEGTCVGAGLPCYGGSASGVAPNVGLYPRMHLMPSGLVSNLRRSPKCKILGSRKRQMGLSRSDFVLQTLWCFIPTSPSQYYF